MSHPNHNGSSSPSDTREPSSTPEQIDTTSASIPQDPSLSFSYESLNNDNNSPSSAASSTYSASDIDSPIMTKASLPRKSTTNNTKSNNIDNNNHDASASSSWDEKSGSTHKHGWPNGKRPRGFRTKEGKEAAEKSKNYKTGVSIPHLTARCHNFEGVLKHSILGAIRKCRLRGEWMQVDLASSSRSGSYSFHILS
jgi:hypothetical protein